MRSSSPIAKATGDIKLVAECPDDDDLLDLAKGKPHRLDRGICGCADGVLGADYGEANK
jgi:hypothetical protein